MSEDIWSQDCFDKIMLDKPIHLAIDSETTGLAWPDTAIGVSFAWYVGDELRSGYIDIRHAPDLWNTVKEWIKETKPELVGHNFKFDMHKLGIYPQNFHDTCLIIYILNENYPKALKVLANKLLKEDTDEATVLAKARKELKLKVSDGYDKLPLSVVAPYAIKDAEFTLRLYSRLSVALAKEPELEEVYSLEKQLLLAVAGTERRGIGVDTDYLKEKIIELGDEIVSLIRQISEIVGRPVGDGKKKVRVQVGKFKNGNPKFKHEAPNEFNPYSPPQITAYFNSIGITLEGTAESVLEGVAHPLAEALVKLRTVSKYRNTFLVPILKESMYDDRYSRMVCHPNLNLTKTRTKRMSSSGASDV